MTKLNATGLLAEAEMQKQQAEARAFRAEVQLAASQMRLEELEAKAVGRTMADASAAVRELVACGKIGKSDLATQMRFEQKFLADPSMIPLAAGIV